MVGWRTTANTRNATADSLDRIAKFRSGDLFLGTLIANLEALLGTMERASDQWIDDFRSAWGDLEISYAIALDQLTPISDVHDPGISDALFDLSALVVSALAHLDRD